MSVPSTDEPALSRAAHAIQWAGLVLGPLLAVLVYFSLGGRADPAMPALTEPGRRVIALAVVMGVWWLTEALPLSVTALLPVAVLPMLNVAGVGAAHNTGTIEQATEPYADPVLFLFMGGFIIGEALQRSGLHRRLALGTLLVVGASPARMVGGVMLATGLISMWVSNTATTLMMLPIGLSMVALVEARAGTPAAAERGWDARAVANFSTALILGIAYAASIGGMGTPVGTPPNLIMLNYVRSELHRDVGFLHWMAVGVPLVAVFLPACWALVMLLHPVRAGEVPGGRAMLREEMDRLGPKGRAEWVTLVVFLLAAAAWITRSWLARAIGRPLSDAGIAIMASLVLFVVPIGLRPRRTVITYKDVERLPWGILLLFGGGLSIAEAMTRTGVDTYLGALFGSLSGLSTWVVVLILVAAVTAVGELASNAAVVTALMPILAAAGKGMGIDPLPLMLAATLGSSCGYMLPVATPPNALAYATGRVRQAQMVRAGFLLDVIGVVLVTAAVVVAGRWLAQHTGAAA